MKKAARKPDIASNCAFNYISIADLAGKQVPVFDAFPATPVSGLSPAAVALQNDPQARRYRTVLREGAARGPNFAGHFTIVGWGCGTSCLHWAIVNAKSGKVIFPPTEIGTVSTVHVIEAPYEPIPEFNGLRFRLDSNLLMILGAPNEDESREGILFYAWTGTTLAPVQAHKIQRDWCK